MSKANSRRTLLEVKGQVENCLSIYDRELLRRSYRDPARVGAFAPNGDVIYGHLFPRAGNAYTTPAMEALRQSRAVKTLILPGVKEEVESIYEYHRRVVETPFYTDVAPLNQLWLDDKHEGILDQLKLKLATYCATLSDFHLATDRLSAFLSSPIVDTSGLPKAFPVGFSTEGFCSHIYKHLTMFPSEYDVPSQFRRIRSDLVESRKLSTILAASQRGVDIPFITDESRLTNVFEDNVKTNSLGADGLLVGSFTAVTMISLINAHTVDITRLRDSAVSLLKLLPTGDLDNVREKFNDYLELTFRLAEISSLVNLTWEPPDTKLPEELDLRHLAVIALEQLEAINKELGVMAGRVALIGEQRSPVIEVRGSIDQSAPNFELLKGIQTGNEKVIIQKLIILQGGAQMSEYTINQSGKNLTAIVDSYKTQHLVGDGLPNELELKLQAFLDGVSASHLSEEAKKDVTEAATKVVEEFKKDGHLAGTAKMLWSGLGEAIKSIPAALSAWDALQKHWS